MDEFYEPEFDEYNDLDATSCAEGDYNEFEEREVFNDQEGIEDQHLDSMYEDRYEIPEYEEFDY